MSPKSYTRWGEREDEFEFASREQCLLNQSNALLRRTLYLNPIPRFLMKGVRQCESCGTRYCRLGNIVVVSEILHKMGWWGSCVLIYSNAKVRAQPISRINTTYPISKPMTRFQTVRMTSYDKEALSVDVNVVIEPSQRRFRDQRIGWCIKPQPIFRTGLCVVLHNFASIFKYLCVL